MASSNVTYHPGLVSSEDRARVLGQRGCILWFTGLSGSGKSTIATALERELTRRGKVSYVLDGDNLRHGLNADLGFSSEDRAENIRRVSHVASILADAGIITITALISPMRENRQRAREAARSRPFLEIFIDTPLEVCEQRDPKKLYQKARRGEIPEFTGISAPYESPVNPEITIETASTPVDEAVRIIISQLAERGYISGGDPKH